VPPTKSFMLQLWPPVEAQGKGIRRQADRLLGLSILSSVPPVLNRGHLQAFFGVASNGSAPRQLSGTLFIIKDPGSRCSCKSHTGMCFTAAQAGEAKAQPHHSLQLPLLSRLSSELHASSGREGTPPWSTHHVPVHCCKLWAPVWAEVHRKGKHCPGDRHPAHVEAPGSPLQTAQS